MTDRYFVFRRAGERPIFGYGSDREAAHYLAHLNRNANTYTVRRAVTEPAEPVVLLSLALIDLAETAD